MLTLVFAASIWGWWSMNHVTLDAIPDLSDTQVIVYSRWDRSPDIVEDQVTYPIVTALLGAPKVKAVRGFSDFGYSFVYVIFEDGTDLYWARTRTLEYLSRVLQSLPQGAKTELGPDATGLGWVFQYALVDQSGRHSLADLRSLQDWYLRYHLTSVPGVAEVAAVGGFGKQYQVNVDPNRLQAYNIPINKVVDAIRGSNNETGGRMIELGGAEYMIRGRGYAKSISDIEDIVVFATENGSPIRVRDIGQVTLGPDLRRGVADLDGTGEAVSGIVVMRQGENALELIGRVKEKIRQIEPGLPAGRQDRSRVRPLRTHPQFDRNAEVHRHRGDRDGVPGRAAVPVAHSERDHPHDHDSDRRVDRVHSFSRDGHHGEHHVARGASRSPSVRWWMRPSWWWSRRTRNWRHGKSGGRRGDYKEVIIQAVKEVGAPSFFALLVIAVSFLPVLALESQEGRLFKPLAYTKNFAMIVAAMLAITLDPALRLTFTRLRHFSLRPRWLSKAANAVLVGRIHSEDDHPVSRILIRVLRAGLPLVAAA